MRLDWSEWGFGPSAGVKRGLEAREGVPFSGGLSGVELLKEVKLVRRVLLAC
jgi:hypothetical protein